MLYNFTITKDKEGKIWTNCPQTISVAEIKAWNSLVPEKEQKELDTTGVIGNKYIPRTYYPYFIEIPDKENNISVMSYDNGGYTYEESWEVVIDAYSANRAVRIARSFVCA